MTVTSPTSPPIDIPTARTDSMLAALAERVGARFGATTVFGDPVERDGATVIPVASVRFGFGAGSGHGRDEEESGEGGGAGGMAEAAGYIELKDGRTRFVPAVRPERMVALAGAIALACAAIMRGRRR
jgi:uncharacterized spore protein YtfJ